MHRAATLIGQQYYLLTILPLKLKATGAHRAQSTGAKGFSTPEKRWISFSSVFSFFWVVYPSELVLKYQSFGETSCLSLQGCVCRSDMLVSTYDSTWHYNPEDQVRHHHGDRLKSHNNFCLQGLVTGVIIAQFIMIIMSFSFIYGLLNDTVSISDCTESNHRTTYE